jgi:hypothetical protein
MDGRSAIVRLACLAVLALEVPQRGGAQNLDSLRKAYLLPLPPTIEVAASASRGAPGSSSGSPTGYGANWGDGFVGGGYQNRTRYSLNKPWRGRMDGSVVAGFGLGNARDLIGFEAAVTSFSTFRSGLGKHSAISFKFHRVLPRNVGVAVGWENALRTDGTDGGKSIYGVATSVIKTREMAGDPFSSVTISAGLGGGRFQRESDIGAGRNGVNPFASLGVRVLDPVSVIADWTGQDLTLAVSVVPIAEIPLVITPGFADVTHSAGDGPRFTIGMGLGFRFAQIRDILAPNR